MRIRKIKNEVTICADAGCRRTLLAYCTSSRSYSQRINGNCRTVHPFEIKTIPDRMQGPRLNHGSTNVETLIASLGFLGSPINLARLLPRTSTFDIFSGRRSQYQNDPHHTTQYVRGVPHHSHPACRHRFPFAQLEYQRYSDNASSCATNTKTEHTTFPGANLSYRLLARSRAPRRAPRNANNSVRTRHKRGLRLRHRLHRRQRSTMRRRRLVRMP